MIIMIILNNLAILYIHQERYSEARQLADSALSTLENIFEMNHPTITQVHKTITRLEQLTENTTELVKLM